MNKQYINFNGEIFPAEEAVMGIGNRGFKYGDGLFESMRLMQGELKFADLHVNRLRRGMKALKLEGYSHVDAYFLREKVEELTRRNKTGPNARVRFTVFRDAGGLYNPDRNKMGYALEVNKIADSHYTGNNRGLILDIFDEITKPVNLLSNLKTNNSMLYVLAGVFKNQHSLDEVL
ncbi:MAG TPA: aminotransferase class IV, partial [Daejeonella sp.]|nr:aminotransferase class IV [Daejeonella sp.]